MRVMLDTNILVSSIFFPSKRTSSFLEALSLHEIVIAQYAIDELQEVTAEKFPQMKKKLDAFFKDLPYELLPTANAKGKKGIPMIRDVKDVPILATAILENVDILVTGDEDFLVLQTERPEIMTMAEFEKKYR